MSKATLQGVEDALRAHFEDVYEIDGDVMVDWVAGVTFQRYDADEDAVLWRNDCVSNPIGNPNAHVTLGVWVSEQLSGVLEPVDAEEESE